MRTLNDERYGEVVHCIGPLIQFSRSNTVCASRLTCEPGRDAQAILMEHGLPAEGAFTSKAARFNIR